MLGTAGIGPNVINTYLACDLAAGRCVNVDPPVVPGWLDACAPAIAARAATYGTGIRFGVLPDTSCKGGLCAWEIAQGESCLRQGCTLPCAHTGDCPPDSFCTAGDSPWEVEPYCVEPSPLPRGHCRPRLGGATPLTCR
jgi:hypothetical protein